MHDTRRFHYTCALLELLAAQPLPALSGCAQRVLLAAVEEVNYKLAVFFRIIARNKRLNVTKSIFWDTFNYIFFTYVRY